MEPARMIRIDNIEQGTPEWFAARCGIPTASLFKHIITPTGSKSGSSDNYCNRLVQEWATGETDSGYKTEWMEQGNKLEPQARDWYAFINDTTVEQTGIVYQDNDRLISCSPDGLIPAKRKGLEIKCPKLSTFIDWSQNKKMPIEHKPQVQGSLYVTGYESWDFMAYHPGYHPIIITVQPDLHYQKVLHVLLKSFIKKMLAKREHIAAMRLPPQWRKPC